MNDRHPERPEWLRIEVDGEPFEWRVFDAVVSESDGRPPHVPRRSRGRTRVLLALRRPSDDVQSFAVACDPAVAPDESMARQTIRSFKDSTPLASEWWRDERAHARHLAVYWSRLPMTAQRELTETWLERCARRCGSVPAVEDRGDLHEVSMKTLRAARGIGIEEGDDESAAQEREVRSVFGRHFGDG